jgi:hypothetical protein
MNPDQKVFRRRVLLRTSFGRASADVEDDQHRFGIEVRHDGHCVTALTARAIRTPWTTCGLGVSSLDRFVGIELTREPFSALRKVRLAHQCTHMADMASLAIAAAARGTLLRLYDVAITHNEGNSAAGVDAVVVRDGGEVSRWRIRDRRIAEPKHLLGLEIVRAASRSFATGAGGQEKSQ